MWLFNGRDQSSCFAKTPKKIGPPCKNADTQQRMRPLFYWLSMDTKKINEDYEVFQITPRTFEFRPRSQSNMFNKIDLTLSQTKQVSQIVLWGRTRGFNTNQLFQKSGEKIVKWLFPLLLLTQVCWARIDQSPTLFLPTNQQKLFQNYQNSPLSWWNFSYLQQ